MLRVGQFKGTWNTRKRVKNTARKIFWLQVKMLHYELVYQRKAGKEEKPLIYLNQNSLFLLVNHFMLAIKFRVNKITKKIISSNCIKVMHSLKSKQKNGQKQQQLQKPSYF